MPKTPPVSTGEKSPKKVVKRINTRKPFRTNVRCTECSRDLRDREGAICDECRLTKMGWKKV